MFLIHPTQTTQDSSNAVPHEAGVETDSEEGVVLEARVVHRQVGALQVLRHDGTELSEDYPLVLDKHDKTKEKMREGKSDESATHGSSAPGKYIA